MQLFTNVFLAALSILPLLVAAKKGDAVPNSYIVVLNDDISPSAFDAHRAWANDLHSSSLAKRGDHGLAGLRHTFNMKKLKGYSGSFDNETIAEISGRPEVAYVEQDRVVELDALITQISAPSWGLGRISSRARGSSNYYYDSTAGAGVTVYVIDTGILTTHNEFGGRATFGYNAVDSSNTDGNGHGTHVSGTIGGTTYGVAKKVNLVAVKVLDSSGSGTNSGVIAGIQWASANSAGKKAVANMSLGGSYSSALNSAVSSAVSNGVTFVVAAGNSNANAGNFSPASAAGAITVGATTNTDARASYSNYGSVLDVFAPGSSITSSYIGSNSATAVLSGTSMASPHVAGLAAYLIALEGLRSPSAVLSRINSLASTGYVSSPGPGSPNRLIYNNSGK
ncbi:alkaline proteinase [Sphaerosporella brunnea]|uniref:Alkaline proteinase n=1 Tax=Sphaerosporella brunnea TaxID=1250544 RepID=A0A5J5F0P3_9PEZI|nr:alkaline proteinase [Sphaerosporella brunnea]